MTERSQVTPKLTERSRYDSTPCKCRLLLILGFYFNYNGSYVVANSKLMDQARRTLFAARTNKNKSIPVELHIKLCDSIFEPILLYGSEVWGFENISGLEKIHLKFCKNPLI